MVTTATLRKGTGDILDEHSRADQVPKVPPVQLTMLPPVDSSSRPLFLGFQEPPSPLLVNPGLLLCVPGCGSRFTQYNNRRPMGRALLELVAFKGENYIFSAPRDRRWRKSFPVNVPPGTFSALRKFLVGSFEGPSRAHQARGMGAGVSASPVGADISGDHSIGTTQIRKPPIV